MQIFLNPFQGTQSVSFTLDKQDFGQSLFNAVQDRLLLNSDEFKLRKLGVEIPLHKRLEEIHDDAFPLMVDLYVPLVGGKGGFATLLRHQGVRMGNKKGTNMESCRDLSGRRLAVTNEATRVADHVQGQSDRNKEQKEKVQKKIKQGLKETNVEKRIVMDAEFKEKHEKVLETIEVAVSVGLKQAKAQVKRSKKPWEKK